MAGDAGAFLAIVFEYVDYFLHELRSANGVCFDICCDVYNENLQNEM